MYYLSNSLSPQTMSVELEPKFQAPVLPSKIFWLRPSKIAWAPAPQPWLWQARCRLQNKSKSFLLREL